MSSFDTQVHIEEVNNREPFHPDQEDWSDYCDYLDSIGYDYEDDDWEEDADDHYGFQPHTFIDSTDDDGCPF